MKEFFRLLRFVRPYTLVLLSSVVLMAIVGATQALTAVLIAPVFDRVLQPDTPDSPVPLFHFGGFRLFLQDILPASIHNVWTLVAIGIFGALLL